MPPVDISSLINLYLVLSSVAHITKLIHIFIACLEDIQKASAISVDKKTKLLKHQSFMKTKVSNQVEWHSPCLELCMDHAFGSCTKPQDTCSYAVAIYKVASSVNALLPNIVDTAEQSKLEEKLDSLLPVHKRYFGHLLYTEY